MKTFAQFHKSPLEEAKNLGQQYEIKIIKGLERIRKGGRGSSLSGRGSDSVVEFRDRRTGKTRQYSMGIKAEGAVSGQIQFRYRDGQWHYESKPEDRLGGYLADIFNKTVPGWMNAHYGAPRIKPDDRKGLIGYIRGVTKTKGELVVPFEYTPEQLAHILHISNNGDDLIQIQGKGTYALTRGVANSTGLPWLGDAVDGDDAEYFLTLRHRVKVHSSSKGVYSLTAELHLDTELLEPSHFDVARYVNVK
jgi:hypothetical protein